MSRRSFLVIGGRLAAASVLLARAPVSWAQDAYPSRPIRMVVPFPPGGETDIFCRAIATRLSEVLGQNVVIDNRGGASGMIGTEQVAKAAPDGYTLVFGTAATHALNLSVFRKVPYHPLRDFETVAFVGSVPVVVYANPAMPANLREFTALLRANPRKYAYGAAGSTVSHLAIELYKAAAGLEALHVPYQGTAPALQDAAAGQVQFLAASVGAGAPLAQAGRLRAIGVMAPARLPTLPEVPTFAEAGIPDLNVGTWNVVSAPKGTPRAVVERLNAAINQVLSEAAIRSRLETLGIVPVADSTPTSAAVRIEAEIGLWNRAFKLSGAPQQ